MFQLTRNGKLLFAVMVLAGLSVLVGGCVGVKEKLVPLGVAERAPSVGPGPTLPVEPRLPGTGGPLLACGLQEVSVKESELNLETFWQEAQILYSRKALEAHSFKQSVGALRVFASPSVKLGFVPFGAQAGIAWQERNGQRQAVALVKQADGTLNIYPDGREETWTAANAQAIVEGLRQQDRAFQAFEKQLAAQRKQIVVEQSLALVQGTRGRLYLTVISRALTGQRSLSYYQAALVSSREGGYQLAGAPLDLCAPAAGEIYLGSKDGASMSLAGVYGTAATELELQIVRAPKDPCILGASVLACLDMPSLRIYQRSVQSDHVMTEFVFEPAPQQRLHVRHDFDQAQQEVVITFESLQGDRLQVRARILQVPETLDCPILLPSDFKDPQRLQETYKCLVDAGLRVELRLQLNAYTVTLPTALLSESNYAVAEALIRGIAERADPLFKKIVESFAILVTNEQVLAQCLLNPQTQPGASRMVVLADNCAVICGMAAAGYALSWAGLFTGGAGTVAGAVVWIAAHLLAGGSGAYSCGSCLKKKQQPPPPPPPSPPPGGCFGGRSIGLTPMKPTPC